MRRQGLLQYLLWAAELLAVFAARLSLACESRGCRSDRGVILYLKPETARRVRRVGRLVGDRSEKWVVMQSLSVYEHLVVIEHNEGRVVVQELGEEVELSMR